MTAVLARPDGPVVRTERAEPVVAVRGLTHVNGRGSVAVTALAGVDLQVAAGEFVCVVGASGCGKTTLLSLLAGLDRPTAGEVAVDSGQPALVFQESALLPWLTVGGNIALALRLAGVARRERPARVEDLLATVRLSGLAGRRPHELSGGMRQRVAIARALAQDSRLLLMDEPFGALDAMTRGVLHDELERMWSERGLTVVFVTHDVREAVRLGSRVLVLSSRPGRIVADVAVELARPRPDDAVAPLAERITALLRAEVRRHAG